MSKSLRNTTASPVSIETMGVTIDVAETYIIIPSEYDRWAIDDVVTELSTLITAGDLVVNDGINDLTVANGFDLQRAIDYIRFPDDAFNMRFLSDPDRMNSFESKNVQEAIEESRDTSTGKIFVQPFFNNGNTGNKWLFHISTSDATDTLPYVPPYDLEVIGIVMNNKVDDQDVDIEFYVNGLTAPFIAHTTQVRLPVGQTYAYETTNNSFFTMNAEDSLSVFIKKVGGDSLATPVVDVFFRVVNNVTGSSGIL